MAENGTLRNQWIRKHGSGILAVDSMTWEIGMRTWQGALLALATTACEGTAEHWVSTSEGCTLQVGGEHTAVGLGGGTRCREILWDQEGGYTRISVDGFDPDVRSVSLTFDQAGIETWLASPTAPPNSRNLADYTRLFTEFDGTAEVDSLTLHHRWEAQALDFVVATPEAGAWSACIELDRDL